MKKVIVIGGAVLDIFAYSANKIQMYDSNPGYLTYSFGGVGRNIAENLVRLGVDTTLITVLGNDEAGKNIIDHSNKIGLKLSIVRTQSTPSYISVMDENKDTVVAIAAMEQILSLTKTEIKSRNNLIENSDCIVLDTNLSEDTLNYIFHQFNKPIYVDAISGPKSIKLQKYLSYITGLKMNSTEASILSNLPHQSTQDIKNLGQYFINQGVKEVYITLGAEGSFYINETTSIFQKPIEISIKNTTGAGDAFFAGAIYAKIIEQDPLIYAMASASINLQDEKAVSDSLTVELLKKTIKEYQK